MVFAKRPEPGQVKTRLCPPFSLEQAAAFYACMLEDVLEASGRAAATLELDTVLDVHPPEAASTLPAPPGWRREAQLGPDLGARMEHALLRELGRGPVRERGGDRRRGPVRLRGSGRGPRPVLLRGSDSPTLGLATLRPALAALARADVVICPDRDGGYNLIGLRRAAPGLFGHPMSTGTVLEDTLGRARQAGLSSELLPAGFDIDCAADLALLAAARERGEASECPRTLAWLDRHGLWMEPPEGT